MAYGVIFREKMQSEFDGTKRISGKYLPSAVATAIENGNVVLIGSLVTGEREVYTLTTPAANSALTAIGVVTTPEVMADERKKNLDEFRNEAGEVITVDKLCSGDIFSVTVDALTGTKAVGNVVELQAGTKLNTAATLTASSTKVGTLIDITNGMYAIQVV
jgi:hypothetical protein